MLVIIVEMFAGRWSLLLFKLSHDTAFGVNIKLEKQSEILRDMGLSSLFYLFILAATVPLDVSASLFTLMQNSNVRLISGVSICCREHRCTDFTFIWSLIQAQDCSKSLKPPLTASVVYSSISITRGIKARLVG